MVRLSLGWIGPTAVLIGAPTAADSVFHVFDLRSLVNVVWMDARRIVACVVYLLAGQGQAAKLQKEAEMRGGDGFSYLWKPELAVVVLFFSTCSGTNPKPTRIALLNLLPKPLLYFFAASHGSWYHAASLLCNHVKSSCKLCM